MDRFFACFSLLCRKLMGAVCGASRKSNESYLMEMNEGICLAKHTIGLPVFCLFVLKQFRHPESCLYT